MIFGIPVSGFEKSERNYFEEGAGVSACGVWN
jgi:hypothetical protein